MVTELTDEDRWVSPKIAMEMLGVTRNYIRKLRIEGRVRAYYPGGTPEPGTRGNTPVRLNLADLKAVVTAGQMK